MSGAHRDCRAKAWGGSGLAAQEPARKQFNRRMCAQRAEGRAVHRDLGQLLCGTSNGGSMTLAPVLTCVLSQHGPSKHMQKNTRFPSPVQQRENRNLFMHDWFEAAEEICLNAHLLLVPIVLPGQTPHLITAGCRGNDAQGHRGPASPKRKTYESTGYGTSLSPQERSGCGGQHLSIQDKMFPKHSFGDTFFLRQP